MQSHAALVRGPSPTSFLSLPFELRDQIYRLTLRSLPRVRPMLYSRTIPIYCLQNLDPRPLFVHPQIQHKIEALLASHTRIQIPESLDIGDKSPLSASTQQWLQESSIEFKRVRVWSGLPVPIILDVNISVDGEVAVHHKWCLTGGRWRLYSWGRWILGQALPVMLEYLFEGLRKRVGARGGTGMGIGEMGFLMESMGRFRSWFAMHRQLHSQNSRLPAGSYEDRLAYLCYLGDEKREGFRQRLKWWDDIEAEVRDLKKTESHAQS